MEMIYREEFLVDDLAVDRYGRLRPAMLLYYAQEIAGRHALRLGAAGDALTEKRLFWAVIRHRVHITRLPRRGETIHLETWPMPTTKVAYPRAVAAFDTEGKPLFSCVSLWVFMDMDTRSMVLPGRSGVAVDGILRGCETEMPTSLLPRGLTRQTTRTVTYSLLDVNGHMNNTRYLEWVDDLLDSTVHATLTPGDFTICYLAEAREGQEMVLEYALSEDGLLQVDAKREKPGAPGKQERVFSAQVQYIQKA